MNAEPTTASPCEARPHGDLGVANRARALLHPSPYRLSFAVLYYSLFTTLYLTYTAAPAEGWSSATLRWASGAALGGLLGAGLVHRLRPRSLTRLLGAVALGIVLAAYALAALLDFLSVLFFEQRLSTATIFVLAETSVRESLEFLTAYAHGKVSLAILFVLLPLVPIRGPSFLRRSVSRTYLVALTLAFVLASLHSRGGDRAAAYDPALALLDGVRAYRVELAAYRRIAARLALPDLEGRVQSLAPGSPKIEVLILGESTSRNHMSLYGYHRDTSPRLRQLRDQLYVFSDVISPHSNTMGVLRKLFTFANAESEHRWHRYPLLLDLYKAAGYRTYWISNQEPYGIWSNSTTVIANRADVRIFHEPSSSREALFSNRVDGELLPYLDRVLRQDSSERKFIVIHLKGSHIAYRHRYPRAFARFSRADPDPLEPSFMTLEKRRTVNEYDNSVLYNDHVVAEIVDRIAQENAYSYVLYLSDHAEEVYEERDFVGHKEAAGSRFMVEIPLVLWLSPWYRERNLDRVARLDEYLDRPYMIDDAIHTLLDLSSIRHEGWEPERSIVHPRFDSGRRRPYAGRDYDLELRPTAVAPLPSRLRERVWAHRVNAVEKLRAAAGVFSGVEVDLVFHEEDGAAYFEVNHPPAESIGLSLDAYLSSLETPERLRYWLDLKNLGSADPQAVAQHLRAVLHGRGLGTDHVIVEGRNIPALSHLSAAGFHTSYYLPDVDVDALTSDQLVARAQQLATNVRGTGARFISFPGAMLPFARDGLAPLLPDIRLLLWFPGKHLDREEDVRSLQPILEDERVEVVLVGFPTEHDR